jgi:hypothetical protein
MTDNEWKSLRQRVNQWAKTYRNEDFMYGSPYSYWAFAKSNDIISQAEFDYAEKQFGQLWHYRGD